MFILQCRYTSDYFLRYHQKVNWGLRINVMKCQRLQHIKHLQYVAQYF